MQIHIFATDDGTEEGTGPLQFVPDEPRAILLDNPRGLPWRYFATVSIDDTFLKSEPDTTRKALLENRSVVSKRLASRLPGARSYQSDRTREPGLSDSDRVELSRH